MTEIQWGVLHALSSLQALNGRRRVQPKEIRQRMRQVGYGDWFDRSASINNEIQYLKDQGLIERPAQYTGYDITDEGCIALEQLAFRISQAYGTR